MIYNNPNCFFQVSGCSLQFIRLRAKGAAGGKKDKRKSCPPIRHDADLLHSWQWPQEWCCWHAIGMRLACDWRCLWWLKGTTWYQHVCSDVVSVWQSAKSALQNKHLGRLGPWFSEMHVQCTSSGLRQHKRTSNAGEGWDGLRWAE